MGLRKCQGLFCDEPTYAGGDYCESCTKALLEYALEKALEGEEDPILLPCAMEE